MAAKGNSFAERFARWQVMADNLREVEGFAHVTADHQLLQERLAEARVLEGRVEDLRSQFRAVTARMRKLATEGDTIRGRIGANLQGRYGFTSEALIRYGVTPRRPPRRRSKKETPVTQPPAAAPAETDAKG
jgi:hypothetical protein